MREAFGGVFMFRLLLVFVFIYVAFTAVSLNYAKAFRVKNKVISYLEENDITDLSKLNCDTDLGPLILKKQYIKSCKNGNGLITDSDEKFSKYCCNGVVITEKEITNNNYTYIVNTYADWNIGTLNMLLALGGESKNNTEVVNGTWKITGEATVKRRK